MDRGAIMELKALMLRLLMLGNLKRVNYDDWDGVLYSLSS